MILNDLKEEQWRHHLTDTQIASALCISRGYWNGIKNGKYLWNDKLEMKARQIFPDIFLPNDITKVKKDFTEVSQTATETHQNQRESPLQTFYRKSIALLERIINRVHWYS